MTAPPEVAIRAGGSEDLAALVRLEGLAFTPPWNSAQLASYLALPTSRTWLLSGGTPSRTLAYALFQVVAGEAELLRVGCDPGHRRRGLGRRLLAAALDALAAAGVERCFLDVAAGNHAALALYRSLGFRETGRRPGYYPSGETALLFTRESRTAR
ncbi:MAG TPA: GNAT family N-acetyltransferase [Thermoanaerobaculia bacterium]|nr:GNAT family N-acetyltransferase [Thermoanaerobaculia bacterium]MDI9631302.1 GNAT family N-acetyltransferase [Acidobacteriota bacterium]MBP7812019.1 GNAT family N-acetyltransferase [Thermoanaerobaculia bacterium]MBP8845415.1 GNAT family N-acetyltransferase [Thermoanaerobaculia bacterium]HPA95156.1 GNAT family N-acetyltransferase [Thermoanaerobaculia bacterium]